MKKKMNLSLLALLSLGMVSPSLVVADFKVGVIDKEKIVQMSEGGKKAKGEWDKFVLNKQKEIQTEENALKKAGEEFQKQASALSESAKKTKEQALGEKYRRLQQLQVSADGQARKQQQDLFQPVLAKINSISDEIRKKKALNMVIEKGAVAAYDDKDEITDEVIAAYDKLEKSGSTKIKSNL